MNYMFEYSLPVRLELSYKVFHFYFQSEQEMDKLMSESSEKSWYTYSAYKWRILNAIFYLS